MCRELVNDGGLGFTFAFNHANRAFTPDAFNFSSETHISAIHFARASLLPRSDVSRNSKRNGWATTMNIREDRDMSK